MYENFKTATLKIYTMSESVAALSADEIRSLANAETSDNTESFFENMQRTLLDELRQQEKESLCSSIVSQMFDRFPNVEVVMRGEKVMEIYLEGRNAEQDMTLGVEEGF